MYQCSDQISCNIKNLNIKMFNTDSSPLGVFFANKNNAKTVTQDELFAILFSIDYNAIIFSIDNIAIIPKYLLKKDNLLFLNLHHSLLPLHKGRNAEAWAIWEGDIKSGITWHKMSANVDEGVILYQTEIDISEHDTALSLRKKLSKLAIDSILYIVTSDKLENLRYMQPDKANYAYNNKNRYKNEIHYAGDVPNNGILDIFWEISKIHRFLRSIDYGFLNVMGRGKIIYNNKIYIIKSYNIKKSDMFYKEKLIKFTDNNLSIFENDINININLIFEGEFYGDTN